MHHCCVANATLVEVLLELSQIPFACVFIACSLTFSLATCLDVVLAFLVYRVICEVNVSFFCRFLTVCVFLSCESCQSFLEKVDLQRVKTCDESVDPEVIFEAIYEVRIGNVLRDNIAWLPLDLLLAPYNLDASAARGGTWLHDIHVLVVFCFSVHRELTEIVREQVSLGAEVVFRKDAAHPTEIFPHHIFATHLETLREVIYFLILCCFFEVLWLRLSSPHDVPLGTVGPNYPAATRLQRIHDRVVDVSGLRYLKPKRHVMLLEVLLFGNLHLLKRFQLRLAGVVYYLKEGSPLHHGLRCLAFLHLHCHLGRVISKAVLGVREEYSR